VYWVLMLIPEAFLESRPWVADVLVPEAAAANASAADGRTERRTERLDRKTRLRPLIYVYELPPDFNSRMLQYRCNTSSCLHY
jgi:hypothetical protein